MYSTHYCTRINTPHRGEGVAAKRKQHVTTIGASANPFARKAKAAKT